MSDISEQPIQDDKFAKNRVQDSMVRQRSRSSTLRLAALVTGSDGR